MACASLCRDFVADLENCHFVINKSIETLHPKCGWVISRNGHERTVHETRREAIEDHHRDFFEFAILHVFPRILPTNPGVIFRLSLAESRRG